MTNPGTSREAELNRLARLVDLAPLGVIVREFGSDIIVYWSQGAEELYGWSREEAQGKVTDELLATRFPDSRDAVDDDLRRTGRWEGELVHRRRDGEERIVASRQTVESDDRGNPVATLEINTDVTDRRRQEETARSVAERYRLLVENVRDYAIYLLAPDGRVRSWNLGAQRLKGYTPEEIIGQSFTRFYPPEDVAAGLPRRLLDRAASEGRVAHEGWRVRKDGSRFWAYVVITALRDQRGELRGFAKITHDLTERLSAEEARARASREEGARVASEAAQADLKASRDQLSAILAGVAEGITVQDAPGHIVYANDAAARLCGFATVDDLLAVPGREILERFELFDERGDPLSAEQLPGRLAFSNGETPELLVRFRIRSTREERWSLVDATPIRDDTGQVLLSVSIFRDITERRRAEQAARFLGQASAELASSLDMEVTLQRVAQLAVPALADWCVVDLIDDQGALRRVAGAHPDPARMALADELAERYPDDPASTTGVPHVVRTGLPSLFEEITGEQLRAGARDAEHLTILRSLQLRSVMIVPLTARGRTLGAITLVGAESGRRYGRRDLHIAEDLASRAALAVDNALLYRTAQEYATEQHELNASLQQTATRLEQALQTRDDFLAAASHDLRNPIASLRATAELLQRRLARGAAIEPEQLQLALRRIDSVTTRMAGLVDELLDVTRLQMGRPLDLDRRPTDLVGLVRELVAEHQQRTKLHQLRLEASVPQLVGEWDDRRLARVIANLLDNAIKFSPDGGMIQLQVASVVQPEQWAELRIEDHGIGIEEADRDRIFDRFQRGSNVIGRIAGTGIGLAGARHIVESHGGTISVISCLNEGSTFTIRLPFYRDGSSGNGAEPGRE